MILDQEAHDAFATDPDPESLASARIGIEHLSHHGQPLKFYGSTYADWTVHRFTCGERGCRFRLEYRVWSPDAGPSTSG